MVWCDRRSRRHPQFIVDSDVKFGLKRGGKFQDRGNRFHCSISVIARVLTASLGLIAPKDNGGRTLNYFQALFREIRIPVIELDVIAGTCSGFKSQSMADHERHGLGLGFPHGLGCQSAALGSVQHLVRLCCRQHKPTYVAQRFMWRSPHDARSDAPFGAA
jgi:hypothetical protein